MGYHYNDLLVGHFYIVKIKELVGQKYHYLSLKKNIKAYFKGYNVCLAIRVIKHNPYNDLQALSLLSNYLKYFLIDFVTALLI